MTCGLTIGKLPPQRSTYDYWSRKYQATAIVELLWLLVTIGKLPPRHSIYALLASYRHSIALITNGHTIGKLPPQRSIYD